MAYDNLPYEQGQGASLPPSSTSVSPSLDADCGASSRFPLGPGRRFPRSRHPLRQEAVSNTNPVGITSGPRAACLRQSRRATNHLYTTFVASTAPLEPRQKTRTASSTHALHSRTSNTEPMSYRDYNNQHGRPLVDLIPNHRDDLYVSDEEDAFYAKDEDYILHPKWRAMIHRTTNRVPRRVQRYFVIYLAFAIVFLISWRTYLGPRYGAYRQEIKEMDETPEAAFGKNVRPEFNGLVQVKTLDEQHLPKEGKRLVVVGDVHGCRKELQNLLNKVGFTRESDHLILTGDIIAKGPDSPGVVSLAQELGASCVRGNHEDKVLLSIAESKRPHHSALPGPDESIDRENDFLDEESFSHGDHKIRKLAKQFSAQQVEWLQQCPVILRVGKVTGIGEVVVVHAGLVPDMPLEQQDPFHVMNMRTIDLKTRLPSEKRDGTPWEKFWNHRQKKLDETARATVIYGHDRKRGKNIQKYSMGLDSGCVTGGHLTAMVIDASGQHKFVQVKCEKAEGY